MQKTDYPYEGESVAAVFTAHNVEPSFVYATKVIEKHAFVLSFFRQKSCTLNVILFNAPYFGRP
jgi:hypothetical protein